MFGFHAWWIGGDPVAFKKLPVIKVRGPAIKHYHLGNVEDADGRFWNVGAIVGNVIYARNYDSSLYEHNTWWAHRFEVVQ